MGEEVTINVDAEGFTIGFEYGRRSYRELQHPPLSFSLAKVVLACPEDAWRITQARDRIERIETEAMANGTIMDALLTGPEYSALEGERGCESYVYKSGKQKGETSTTDWHDWNGLRIVMCTDFTSTSAKMAKAAGEAKGLTVIKLEDFEHERRLVVELKIRLELAGFDITQYKAQASLYWTEIAANGRTVQCRGRLDFLAKDWTSIVDLKRTEDLSQLALERAVDRYKWALQAAAYSRAVYMLQGCQWVPTWKWLFARTSPVVACTLRPADATLLEAGEAAWTRAVNDWSEGLASGLWRGHESDHTPLMPTPWAIEQMDADNV